jgi:hypothetical protein
MSRRSGAAAPKSGADLIREDWTRILAEGETNMSTAEMMHQIVGGLPRHRSQVVVAYDLLTILTGVFVLSFHGRLAFAADLFATVFYIAMTALFYDLSKPGNRRKWSAAPVPVHDGRKRPTMAGAGWRSERRPRDWEFSSNHEHRRNISISTATCWRIHPRCRGKTEREIPAKAKGQGETSLGQGQSG